MAIDPRDSELELLPDLDQSYLCHWRQVCRDFVQVVRRHLRSRSDMLERHPRQHRDHLDRPVRYFRLARHWRRAEGAMENLFAHRRSKKNEIASLHLAG